MINFQKIFKLFNFQTSTSGHHLRLDREKSQTSITKRFGYWNLIRLGEPWTRRVIVACLVFVSWLLIIAPKDAQGAEIYFWPADIDTYVGDTIVGELRINTEGVDINAAEIEIVFDNFEILGISTGGGIFTIFSKAPEIEGNMISLEGASPGGFSGDGVVGRITIEAKNQGGASVKTTKSVVYLNDGLGTALNARTRDATFAAQTKPQDLPQLFSQNYPEEGRWYNRLFIGVSWEVKEGKEYSYVLSRDINEIPDDIPDEPVGDIRLTTEEDGIFYFHLTECVASGLVYECGPKVTRTFFKDTKAPEPFEVFLASAEGVYGGKKFISFTTTDESSGISRWEVFENGQWYTAQSPYVLKNQDDIKEIKVRATDNAGNQITSVWKNETNYWLWGAIIIVISVFALIGVIKIRKVRDSNQNPA